MSDPTIWRYLATCFSEASNQLKRSFFSRPIWTVASIAFSIIVGDFIWYQQHGREMASSATLEAISYGLAGPLILVIGVYLLCLVKSPFQVFRNQLKAINSLENKNNDLEERMRPKLKVICIHEYPWIQTNRDVRDPLGIPIATLDLHTCRLGLVNPGMTTINNVSVRLIRLSGSNTGPLPFRSLPCHLHFMNDNVEPYKETKNIPQTKLADYRDALFVDVFMYWESGADLRRLAVWHVVSGVNQHIPLDSYIAELAIESSNGGGTLTARVSLELPESDGPPIWRLLSSGVS